jgi:hypothetical protein
MYEVPSGEELRDFLKRHSLTGTAAAAIVGVDARTIRKWTASAEAENRRAIPWSAWRLLQLYSGDLSISDLDSTGNSRALFFDEKSIQVEPSSLTAFGVDINSRYGKASELCEMLQFMQDIALNGAGHYIKSIFYDSKAALCFIEVHEDLVEQDDALTVIYDIAKKYICPFSIMNLEYYGEEPEDDQNKTSEIF